MEWKTVFGSAARMFWSAMQCKRIRRGGDTDDDDLSFALPRNLSFVKESCFDQYSVSSQFVYKPELIKQSIQQDCMRFLMEPESPNKATDDSAKRNGVNGCPEDDTRYLFETFNLEPTENTPMLGRDTSVGEASGMQGGTPIPTDGEAVNKCTDQVTTPESNSTEEGVFMNSMEDVDSPEPEGENSSGRKPSDRDDTYYCRSPEEPEEMSPRDNREALEEAINRAADDLRSNPPTRSTSPPTIITSLPSISVSPPISATPPEDIERREGQVLLTPTETDSEVFGDDEFNFKRSELRKTTSLKSGKTPPGTPHRKKMVRFADAMGLDLESVRHILNKDVPPKIPASAMADLREGLAIDRPGVGSKYLTACFQQPGAAPDFHKRVTEQKVCLENAIITDLTITGFIRVANVGFQKEVQVRFSTDNWGSFHDIGAAYVLNSCDSRTDRFSFSLVAPANFDVGQKVQFAIFYKVNDEVYWDSNSGENYVFECFAKTIPTENENAWLHFL